MNGRELRTGFSLFTLRADVNMYLFAYKCQNVRTHAHTYVCVHMNDNDGNDADEAAHASLRLPPDNGRQ